MVFLEFPKDTLLKIAVFLCSSLQFSSRWPAPVCGLILDNTSREMYAWICHVITRACRCVRSLFVCVCVLVCLCVRVFVCVCTRRVFCERVIVGRVCLHVERERYRESVRERQRECESKRHYFARRNWRKKVRGCFGSCITFPMVYVYSPRPLQLPNAIWR